MAFPEPEPWAYLRDVILELSVDASPEILTGLLPDRRALTHPQHILTHRLEESRSAGGGRSVETSVARSDDVGRSETWRAESP
jgi:transposase